MEIQEILEKAQSALAMCSEAISILQTIVIAVLAGKVSRNSKNVAQVTRFVEPADVKNVVTSSNGAKKNISKSFANGLALYFSGKNESDMTEAEKLDYLKVKLFIEQEVK